MFRWDMWIKDFPWHYAQPLKNDLSQEKKVEITTAIMNASNLNESDFLLLMGDLSVLKEELENEQWFASWWESKKINPHSSINQ